MASGHVNRTNRPNTWLHRPAMQREDFPCQPGAVHTIHGTGHRPWLVALLARRPTKVAAIALANKIARMAWAIMVRAERYKEPKLLLAA